MNTIEVDVLTGISCSSRDYSRDLARCEDAVAAPYNYGREALEFIDQMNLLKNANTIFDMLGKHLARSGFDAFLVSGLPPDPNHDIGSSIILNGWPPGWFDHYVRENLHPYDPCVARVSRSVRAFAWDEVVIDRQQAPRAALVMDRATDFGLKQGFCVPIHHCDGSVAVVTVAGKDTDLSDQSRSALTLISMFAHSKAIALRRPELSGTQRRKLSTREREVLTWAAFGKTNDAIGDILGISGRTVETIIGTAARKLGTASRIRTVVTAYQVGEIRFP